MFDINGYWKYMFVNGYDEIGYMFFFEDDIFVYEVKMVRY